MCGVSGILRFDGLPVARAALERMTHALAHRGPDSHGIWIDGAVGLGHRRLAIRDLSDAGHQPMSDERGEIWVSYNGEIYNDAELREAISRESGYRFRSNCDTEILPIGWRLWGEALFDRIEGMFAIALWDARARSLVLARDGVGIKPLYYAMTDGCLLFASEVKGLLAAGALRPRVDLPSFHTFLATGYADPDRSLLESVRQVPPGSIVRPTGAAVAIRRFWQPRRNSTVADAAQAREQIDQRLTEICRDMRISDVTVGLLLSSGVDSALLATRAGSDIPCYTAGFDDRSHDESGDAARIAQFSGHPWSRVPVAQGADLADDFLAMVEHVDGQLADSSALAHFAISRAVRQEVKVVLAGDGADEFFGGYPTYRASLIAQYAAPWLPRRAARALGLTLSRRLGGADESRVPWHDKLSRFLLGATAPEGNPHAEWRRIAMQQRLPTLYGDAMQPLLRVDPLRSYRAAADEVGGSTLDRCLLADQRYYLPADMLMKVDRMSMAHGLEVRVPFLDRRMMELAGSLDGSLLTGLTGPSKRVLRDLLRSSGMPADISDAAKKGFNVPVARLLRRELRGLGDRLLDRDADAFAPMLRPDAIRNLWREHLEKRANHGYLLWTLLVWGTWRLRHDVQT
jgi:asparagine synthase (glutamine-hydrolysing)